MPRSEPAAASSRSSADLGLLLVVLIWGANFSITKVAIQHIPPLAFTAVRFAASSAILWALQRRLEPSPPLDRRTWGKLVLLGLIGNTLYQLGFILGLARTTASNSALLLGAMPSAVAVLAWLFGVERAAPRVRVGIAVGTAGVILVVASRGVGFGSETMVGDLLTLAAVLCWASYTISLRSLDPSLSPLRVTAITTVTGTPGLILAGLPSLARVDWSAVPLRAWGGLAYASLLSLVVAYFLWNSSVRRVGPSRTAVYMCVTPVIGVLVAWLLLGEVPVPLQAVGAVLVVAGVWLTRRMG